MIPPAQQWAIQIEVTNACPRRCSNCTRLLSHINKPFMMDVATFARCAEALKDFPSQSPPTTRVKSKLIGMLGGEPLIHPKFAELTRAMMQTIPNRDERGLWTGLKWQQTRHAALIAQGYGYINNNLHNTECKHSPVLVAIRDVVPDAQKRRAIINKCWLQEQWSSSCTPKGFFFCEIAGAMDLLFNGPGGLPIEPGCWRRPLADFEEQIDRWCNRCGIPLQLPSRHDHEGIDDISQSNLDDLGDSPRVKAGKFVLFVPRETGTGHEDAPWRYLK